MDFLLSKKWTSKLESENLTDDKLEFGDHFRQYRFQSFSFQICSSSLGSGTLNQLSAEINKFLEKNFGQQLAENGLQQNLFQDQQQLQDNNLAQKMFQQLNLEQPASQEHLSQLRLQDPASAISRQLPKEFVSTAGLQKAAWPAATLTDNLSEQDLSDREREREKERDRDRDRDRERERERQRQRETETERQKCQGRQKLSDRPRVGHKHRG